MSVNVSNDPSPLQPFDDGARLENPAQLNLAGKPYYFAINIAAAVFGPQWAIKIPRADSTARQSAPRARIPRS